MEEKQKNNKKGETSVHGKKEEDQDTENILQKKHEITEKEKNEVTNKKSNSQKNFKDHVR